MSIKTCFGRITLIRTEVNEYGPVEVTPDGNITLPEDPGYDTNVLDVLELSLWCDKCEKLGSDEYEAHGISEDWQEV